MKLQSLAAKILGSLAVLVPAATAGTVAFASGSEPVIDLTAAPRIVVAGSTSNPLLPAAAMLPGDTFTSLRTVTFHGAHAASALGLHAGNFVSRDATSDPACTAADPAAKLDLVIKQAGSVLYQGTVAAFASQHGTPAEMLPLPGRWTPGATATISLQVGLDPSAGNAYMGCRSTVDLAFSTA